MLSQSSVRAVVVEYARRGCRCPKEVYPHVPTVISICLRYLTYDPNYNFDDEDEDDNAMDAEQNDEDYQGQDMIDDCTL